MATLPALMASLIVVGGCRPTGAMVHEEPHGQGPVLPPLVLREVLPDLEAIADSGPESPSEERMRELNDLLETAYLPGYAPARSSAMAQRALVEAEDADWALERALAGHGDPAIRAQCAFLLGDRGRIAALPVLMMRVKYEPDAVVQSWAIGALAKLGCHGALDQLVALMDREDSAQQAGVVAIEVLQAAGRAPGETPSYAQLQQACTELFLVWKERGAPPAETSGDGPQGRDSASGPSFDELEPLLRARLARHLTMLSGSELRPVDDCRFVFMRLGVVGVPVLARGMRAAEPYVRNHVLEIAMALGRPAHVLAEQVLPMLGDQLTGSLAARTLGALGSVAALPYLVERLSAADVETRAAAVAGLGLLGDSAALAPLVQRLQDPNEILDVRVEAAAAIARIDAGRRFLLERLEVGDYHEPTLLELLDAIDLGRARARTR